ncbi:uncharacterized protein BXZ73DRAFT_103933 [Epithele typhae]|uniref:uncharacterized protein n=1 Tax=Epithele typhae TaxID=378194 RepID=UPI0020089F95|nr:uncharacterized protein BXZ73DRAFT_103933 [Epithele typhae]KAH9923135.1 hypothetical protein BXZ73DRAFT_103933 [Epithele typhae]
MNHKDHHEPGLSSSSRSTRKRREPDGGADAELKSLHKALRVSQDDSRRPSPTFIDLTTPPPQPDHASANARFPIKYKEDHDSTSHLSSSKPKTEEQPRSLPTSRSRTRDAAPEHGHVGSSNDGETTEVTVSAKLTRPWLHKPKNDEYARYQIPPMNGQPDEIPEKLQANIASLQQRYSALSFELYYVEFQDDIKWGLKCVSCGCNDIFYLSGLGIHHVVTHLGGKRHRNGLAREAAAQKRRMHEKANKAKKRREVAPQQPSSPPAASISGAPIAHGSNAQHAPAPALDEVERFLEEIGLPTALAGVLRSVGIKDDGRIQALGKLSGVFVEKLDASLADAGLDFADRLLVQSGLKARAGFAA